MYSTHLLGMRRLLVGIEEEKIDVGEGRKLAAAIAADGNDGEALALGWIGERIGPGHGEVVKDADHLIDQESERLRRLGARGAGLEAPAHLGPAVGERALQDFGDRAAGRLAGLGQGIDAGLKGAAVDDFALSFDEAHGRRILHRRPR